MQQIIISGVGGQGVLFITRLLAEAALAQGRHVLISETHGMAQRGGNVVSHLKVGGPKSDTDPGNAKAADDKSGVEFSSPLIRPGRADILLALHLDGLTAHGHYLKNSGKTFCNTPNPQDAKSIDAVRIATNLNSPVSANLVLLAFAIASGNLFCRPDEMERILEASGGKRLETNLKAFRAGLRAGEKLNS